MLGNQGLGPREAALDSGGPGRRGPFSLCLQGPHPACSGLPGPGTSTLVLAPLASAQAKRPHAAFPASDGEPGPEGSVAAVVSVDTLGGSLRMVTTPEAALAEEAQA